MKLFKSPSTIHSLDGKQISSPNKKNVMSSSRFTFPLLLCGLLWNSFMGSWACSMSDSFTQDASIRWYPFDLTKYFHSRPFSCLNLITTSISNLGSLSIRLGGGLELYFWLNFEASHATDLKNKTWNMGWTLRFSSNSSL